MGAMVRMGRHVKERTHILAFKTAIGLFIADVLILLHLHSIVLHLAIAALGLGHEVYEALRRDTAKVEGRVKSRLFRRGSAV